LAIQNFISGGFYGKVGDVVGQRWHNKRTIRAYVKPAYSNTPAQQASRELFAKAVKLAQQAMNINKGAPQWDTAEMGEFALRTGTAKRRLQEGKSDAEALPVYPDGYNPPVVISDLAFQYQLGSPYKWVFSSSAVFSDTRAISYTVNAWNVITKAFEAFTNDIEVQSGGTLSFQFTTAWNLLPVEGSWIEGASNDDAAHGGAAVEVPRTPFKPSVPPTALVPMAWRPLDWNSSEMELSVSLTTALDPPEDEWIECNYRYQRYGEFPVDSTAHFSTGPAGVLAASLYWEEDYQYPAGSQIGPVNQALDCGAYIVRWGISILNITQPYAPNW
jgi:hypothetical protein